jgi:hypothetical protein
MGLPFEQWRDADGKVDGGAPGCRTPAAGASGQQQQGTTGDCPAAPRKRRTVSQQRSRDYYNGADVDDFFAAHNL